MTGFTLYVFRQLSVGTILVTVVLAYILWLSQSLRFVQLIVNKGLTVATWIELTVLLLPTFLVIILPVALFFVVLFVYNRLITDRELVVAQAAGFSYLGLARPALAISILIAGLTYSLTFYFVPYSVSSFKELQWSIRNEVSQILLQDGAFNQITKGLTLYVGERSPSGNLLDLFVHDKRDRTKSITLIAEQGSLVNGPDGPRVIMANGTRQEINRGEGDISLLYFDSYVVNFGIISGAGPARFLDNRERTTGKLLTLTRGDGFSARAIRRMRVEGHQRIANPLTSIGFVLIALSFLLIGGFDRRGQTKRIMGAVAIMVACEAAALGAANVAAKHEIFVSLIYIVALTPIILCGYMLAIPANERFGWFVRDSKPRSV